MKEERLDKVLSNMGEGSRKDVQKIIKKGLVKIDGNIVKKPDFKFDPSVSEIIVGTKKIEYKKNIYLMLNKPKGMISSTDDPRDSVVLELLDDYHRNFKPFPVGRLDKDTEGLLLITNDGDLAHRLTSPKHEIGKTYYADVEGIVLEEHKDIFKNGILLDDGYFTKPAGLEIISSDSISRINLTIYEGKYHQVKRMFGALGMRVLNLKRIRMGPLFLDNKLSAGEYRDLDIVEIKMLKQL
ncbi:MAG: pseudouridine synthase [Gudongella sp.]|nr:pseudouridine synthase [Gudongella sp.]